MRGALAIASRVYVLRAVQPTTELKLIQVLQSSHLQKLGAAQRHRILVDRSLMILDVKDFPRRQHTALDVITVISVKQFPLPELTARVNGPS